MHPPERPIPLTLQQIIMVSSRLKTYHPKQPSLKKSEQKRWAGYIGELMVDQYLERFVKDKFTIIKDLNLVDKEAFQIDTFLYNQFFSIILEIKNVLGKVYFDKYSKQMIRTYSNEQEGFQNPILQARAHQIQLQNWLKKHKLPPFPIVWLVVFSNPATILQTNPGNEQIFDNIIHTNLLLEKITQLEAKFTVPKLNKYASKKLQSYLLTENIPFLINILEKFGIPIADILTGVRCPFCNFVPMLRVSANWYCPNCKMNSKNAHVYSIYDYLLLNQPAITNQQCRDFLHAPSRNTVRAFLSKYPLVGNTKGTSYQLTNLLEHSSEYFLLPETKIPTKWKK